MRATFSHQVDDESRAKRELRRDGGGTSGKRPCTHVSCGEQKLDPQKRLDQVRRFWKLDFCGNPKFPDEELEPS
jgi:hypothetical protein